MRLPPAEDPFLKLLCQMSEQAQHSCALLNEELSPLWCSSAALARWPLLGTAQGTQCFLSGLDIAAIRAEIAALGFFSISADSDPLFPQRALIVSAIPERDGVYYWMQPSDTEPTGSARNPLGLTRSISSFESHYHTSLAEIFSNLSLLDRALQPQGAYGELHPLLKSIQQNSLQLLRSTRMMVTYTRLQSNLLPLRLEQLDFFDFLRALLSATGALLTEVDIPFSYSVPSGMLSGTGDPEQLSSILLQLISNSCRFTRPGNHIVVDVHHRADQLIVRVADHGVGMTPEVCQQAFDPFYSYNPDGAPFAGNGLGLSIAQTLVAKMGGTLSLSSLPGRSTTAVFSCSTQLQKQKTDRLSLAGESPAYLQDRFSIIRILLADILPPKL